MADPQFGQTSAQLPRDRDSAPIQVLTPKGATNLTYTGSSGRVVLPTGAELVFCYATNDVWVKFGDSTVSATVSGSDNVLFSGGVYFRVPEAATHVAAIQDTTTGKLCITRMV